MQPTGFDPADSQRPKRRLFVHPSAVIPAAVEELYEVLRDSRLPPGEWYLGVALKPPSDRFAENAEEYWRRRGES